MSPNKPNSMNLSKLNKKVVIVSSQKKQREEGQSSEKKDVSNKKN